MRNTVDYARSFLRVQRPPPRKQRAAGCSARSRRRDLRQWLRQKIVLEMLEMQICSARKIQSATRRQRGVRQMNIHCNINIISNDILKCTCYFLRGGTHDHSAVRRRFHDQSVRVLGESSAAGDRPRHFDGVLTVNRCCCLELSAVPVQFSRSNDAASL